MSVIASIKANLSKRKSPNIRSRLVACAVAAMALCSIVWVPGHFDCSPEERRLEGVVDYKAPKNSRSKALEVGDQLIRCTPGFYGPSTNCPTGYFPRAALGKPSVVVVKSCKSGIMRDDLTFEILQDNTPVRYFSRAEMEAWREKVRHDQMRDLFYPILIFWMVVAYYLAFPRSKKITSSAPSSAV